MPRSNRRPAAPRRPRRGNSGRKYLIIVLALLMVSLVTAYAWQCMRRGSAPVKTVAAPTVGGDLDLLAVATPADVPSRMIDYPGFRLSFNPDAHQPNWVAWELTGDECTNTVTTRESSAFAPDPDVEGCAQLADYRGSGYDRGHMAPAGDMKWSQEAMDACFYLTNMSPQRAELNSGSWKKLEEKCREWAVRDSAIVIVCGPVLTDRLTQTIGSTGVAVPERYFKVVLAPYADPPRGIGFIMPNGRVPGGMQATAVSIDQVEEITGYDFFAALPDDVEQAVESECNFPRWSRRK